MAGEEVLRSSVRNIRCRRPRTERICTGSRSPSGDGWDTENAGLGEMVMEKRNGLRLSEIAITLTCMMLVLMTLGAVGQTGRRRAKEAVCQANLHQWGGVFADIIEENDGKFLAGVTDYGYYWPIQLPTERQSWRKNRTWFCPTATVPFYDEPESSPGQQSIFRAWGIYHYDSATYEGKTYFMTSDGIAGSYGLNGYVMPIPEKSGSQPNWYPSGVRATRGWRNLLTVEDVSTVPMFLDALRFDLWPLHTDEPVATPAQAWYGDHLAHSCIDRHEGAVNCLFLDGSLRKVGLKELWTLKWHQAFDTTGPWTKAGGVRPDDWPEWMRRFKDY